MLLQEDLRTSGDCIAEWQGNPMMTKQGQVKSKTLKGAPIK